MLLRRDLASLIGLITAVASVVKEVVTFPEYPIARARIQAMYRRGTDVEKQEFELSVSVLQQETYRDQLGSLTQGLTKIPASHTASANNPKNAPDQACWPPLRML